MKVNCVDIIADCKKTSCQHCVIQPHIELVFDEDMNIKTITISYHLLFKSLIKVVCCVFVALIGSILIYNVFNNDCMCNIISTTTLITNTNKEELEE